MKKAKYLGGGFIFVGISIVFLVFAILTLCFKEYVGAGCLFALSLLTGCFVLGCKKILFRKLLINDEGLTLFYNNKIVKSLKWEDISYAKIGHSGKWIVLSFSHRPIPSGKESGKQKENAITINSNISFINELYIRKEKIPVEIEGLEDMPQYYIEKLKTKF